MFKRIANATFEGHSEVGFWWMWMAGVCEMTLSIDCLTFGGSILQENLILTGLLGMVMLHGIWFLDLRLGWNQYSGTAVCRTVVIQQAGIGSGLEVLCG